MLEEKIMVSEDVLPTLNTHAAAVEEAVIVEEAAVTVSLPESISGEGQGTTVISEEESDAVLISLVEIEPVVVNHDSVVNHSADSYPATVEEITLVDEAVALPSLNNEVLMGIEQEVAAVMSEKEIEPVINHNATMNHSDDLYKIKGMFFTQDADTTFEKRPRQSSLSSTDIAEVRALIGALQKEITSFWPYPNKQRKQIKVDALECLLEKCTQQGMDVIAAIDEIETEFPESRPGKISTRTLDLFNRLRCVHGRERRPNNES